MNVARYIKIGLFFLTIGTSGFWFMIMAADGFSPWNTKQYEVILEDATGLNNNSMVYMAGVPVGKVKKIDLQAGKAFLKVSFLKGVEIRRDAKIALQPSSLLGTSVLALTPGTPETPLLEAGGRLSATPPGGDFRETLTAINELSGQIGTILADIQTRHLELVAVSLETIKSLGQKLDQRSETELDRVTRILESSALLAERLERITREKQPDIDASVQEVRAALANIRQITESVKRGEGNVGKVFSNDDLYTRVLAVAERTELAAESLNKALESVNSLATNANKVVTDAGDIVSKANGLGVQVDVRSSYEIAAARAVSGAALRLDPRSGDRWYRVAVSGAPDGITTRTTTTEAVSGGATTTTNTTSNTPGYYFDAELARIFGPFTLRGGILENTAGFGVDFRPIPQLELSGEMFDFSTGSVPNLRASLTFYPFFDPRGGKPWQWLYLRGGIRSALDEKRDFFIGGGLRFVDEEARGLVGLIPYAGN
ncbi:MAG: MlaD family protein [Treponemataceae bacterium]